MRLTGIARMCMTAFQVQPVLLAGACAHSWPHPGVGRARVSWGGGLWVPGGDCCAGAGAWIVWSAAHVAISVHIRVQSGQPCAARDTWELTSCIQFHEFEEAASNSA